ncbi:MAG TPA: tRNA (adenosine(37)-N6)-threonylcarbamoyltransferase complex ATPase subunit type 1 TsaE [Candidatus Portnoybacteria bacterium]|jgi:tRNA threonylcarbamoyladenosine biosynthesis protein TsaE|nr:tRNA (adenosine(37)-N6)-threonylcarbamoyltransferase complex ATPase subunit type 1 TsaE [Candidatus Portnoybacteria bacterium]MDD5752161.1 tRNA (adenosine(37)-N6)-threonylcarbamoyltransferase complex ATPase subunit type 1 TsaE [Candidatus Portnoybacteria bacterium]HNU96865.1 tRNA (adenosine(37)-N6)-threonylcarbamoyltransferase complex ATPase subunit type 1 TsaE [Candidatus Portnoybacteria bacterium]HOZ16443.1 tRNA (adenosine(37)-N6)-threonylcarbamoyltransferase complex ATPase subunit type 1 T
METFLVQNKKQTENLAKMLAKEILKYKNNKKQALVFGFVGNLGAGKTTFIQSFTKGLGIRGRLTSPTFVLMKKYGNLYHLDCYRIKDHKDVLALDFAEIINEPKNIIAIEWAEKIKKVLPKDTIWIKFKILPNNKRKIEIS